MISQRLSDRGSVSAWLMVVPLLILLLGGISVDLWTALSARGRIAAVADDAALTGATAVSAHGSRDPAQTVQLDVDEASRRALAAVDTHPDADRVISRTVHASADLVSVTVEGELAFMLLRLVGGDVARVAVTGHAAPVVRD